MHELPQIAQVEPTVFAAVPEKEIVRPFGTAERLAGPGEAQYSFDVEWECLTVPEALGQDPGHEDNGW